MIFQLEIKLMPNLTLISLNALTYADSLTTNVYGYSAPLKFS